jgi:hypothetical protein
VGGECSDIARQPHSRVGGEGRGTGELLASKFVLPK